MPRKQLLMNRPGDAWVASEASGSALTLTAHLVARWGGLEG